MIKTRPALPSLPILVVLAATIAVTAFGVTKWITAPDATTLPPLDVKVDEAASVPGALNPAKLFAARVDTTVSITASIQGQPMTGSGVVVDARGTIVTASHVVKDYNAAQTADTIVVQLHDGEEVQATLQTIDQFNDLAILKIDPAQLAKPLVAAPLADSDKLVVGAPIEAIGAPYGYEWTPSVGNVSGVHRVIGSRINKAWDIPDAVQFDGAINKGNSGGPLFNARGEVIGISQQIPTPTGGSNGIAFAVSSNIVKRTLAQSQAGAGQASYAWLGVETITLNPQLAATLNLKATQGALVQSVMGPAQRAGLSAGTGATKFLGRTVQSGDAIIGIDGKPVTNREDLLRIQGQLAPNQGVDVDFVRGSERMSATIVPTQFQF